jgi:hypothetical protein
MRRASGRRVPVFVAAVALAAIAVVMCLTHDAGRDYANPPPGCAYWWETCDDSAPAIDALAHGHVGRFFDVQPWAGPLSLVLRAPVVALVDAAGGGVDARYRWGALACMLAAVGLALVLAREALACGRPPWLAGLVALACVFNPASQATLFWGHPEEVLTGALVVGSVLLALRDRMTAAGILLGLAIASKGWALLTLPALVALAGRRRLVPLGVATALAAGVLIAPMAIGSPDRFGEVAKEVGRLGTRPGTLSSTNLPWRVSHQQDFTYTAPLPGGRRAVFADRRAVLPEPVARALRAVILGLAVALALLWARSGASRRPETVLLLIALVLMARAVLDPGNHSYYHAAPLMALLAYETLAARAFPFLSAGFIVLIEAMSRVVPHLTGEGEINLAYLAWAVPFIAWLVTRLASIESRAHGSRPQVDPAH